MDTQDGELYAAGAAVWAALRNVVDPELGIDIVELGLVYELRFTDDEISVRLGLTSPVCPLGEVMRKEAMFHLREPASGRRVRVTLAPEVTWAPSRASPAARRAMGLEVDS